jgi:predicted 3-demethylubiquinone-9 3-methyltransferase (glyoxalase superfamily)
MQKIVPNLWFDHTAEEAVRFYAEAFPDARIVGTSRYPSADLPDFQREFAGQVLTVDFEIRGQRLVAVNAGPEFAITPAISFIVNFDPAADPEAPGQLERLWKRLGAGGEELMPLGAYPFSPRYGWVRDRYGATWQLILSRPEGEPRPFIVPALMFGGPAQNRAQEAIAYYTEAFPDARLGTSVPSPEPTGPAAAGAVMYADLELSGTWLAAMDAATEQPFSFTEGVSLMVSCAGQAEIDWFWERLSRVPEAEACGWCKDQFGVSWQIVPENMDELMRRPQAYQRLLGMKRIVIAEL